MDGRGRGLCGAIGFEAVRNGEPGLAGPWCEDWGPVFSVSVGRGRGRGDNCARAGLCAFQVGGRGRRATQCARRQVDFPSFLEGRHGALQEGCATLKTSFTRFVDARARTRVPFGMMSLHKCTTKVVRSLCQPSHHVSNTRHP